MKFDLSKVYTSLNADDIKPGSIGYLADSLAMLKEKVEQDEDTDTVTKILAEDALSRFKVNELCYNLFYLVEEPREKKSRPYKDINEMVDDFTKSQTHDLRCRPVIWLRNKNSDNELLIVGYYKDNTVGLLGTRRTMFELSEYYEYLDGTPCGIMEE